MKNEFTPKFILMHAGTRYINAQLPDGRTYRGILEEMVRQGKVDPEEANIAKIKGMRDWGVNVLLHVAFGYYNCQMLSADRTYGQELENLLERHYVTKERYDEAIREGKKRGLKSS